MALLEIALLCERTIRQIPGKKQKCPHAGRENGKDLLMNGLSFLQRTVVVLLAATLALVSPVQAVNFEWDGEANNDTWDALEVVIGDDDITNWVGIAGLNFPNADDTVLFGGEASNNDLTVDLNGNRNVISVTFDRAQSYLLDTTVGTNRLSLSSGDITVLDGSHTINSNIRLLDIGDFDISASDTLTVNGGIEGAFRFDKEGPGTLALTGSCS